MSNIHQLRKPSKTRCSKLTEANVTLYSAEKIYKFQVNRELSDPGGDSLEWVVGSHLVVQRHFINYVN